MVHSTSARPATAALNWYISEENPETCGFLLCDSSTMIVHIRAGPPSLNLAVWSLRRHDGLYKDMTGIPPLTWADTNKYHSVLLRKSACLDYGSVLLSWFIFMNKCCCLRCNNPPSKIQRSRIKIFNKKLLFMHLERETGPFTAILQSAWSETNVSTPKQASKKVVTHL